MSAKCHYRKSPLLDHLVGGREQRLRDVEAERLSGLKIVPRQPLNEAPRPRGCQSRLPKITEVYNMTQQLQALNGWSRFIMLPKNNK